MIETIVYLVNDRLPFWQTLAESGFSMHGHAYVRLALVSVQYSRVLRARFAQCSVQKQRRVIEGLRFQSAWCDCGSWYQTFRHSIYDTRLIQSCIVYYYDDLIPRNDGFPHG